MLSVRPACADRIMLKPIHDSHWPPPQAEPARGPPAATSAMQDATASGLCPSQCAAMLWNILSNDT